MYHSSGIFIVLPSNLHPWWMNVWWRNACEANKQRLNEVRVKKWWMHGPERATHIGGHAERGMQIGRDIHYSLSSLLLLSARDANVMCVNIILNKMFGLSPRWVSVSQTLRLTIYSYFCQWHKREYAKHCCCNYVCNGEDDHCVPRLDRCSTWPFSKYLRQRRVNCIYTRRCIKYSVSMPDAWSWLSDIGQQSMERELSWVRTVLSWHFEEKPSRNNPWVSLTHLYVIDMTYALT